MTLLVILSLASVLIAISLGRPAKSNIEASQIAAGFLLGLAIGIALLVVEIGLQN